MLLPNQVILWLLNYVDVPLKVVSIWNYLWRILNINFCFLFLDFKKCHSSHIESTIQALLQQRDPAVGWGEFRASVRLQQRAAKGQVHADSFSDTKEGRHEGSLVSIPCFLLFLFSYPGILLSYQNWEKVVGIEIVTPSLSWVVLNTKRQEIVSCGRHQLLSDVKKLCPSTLLEIVRPARNDPFQRATDHGIPSRHAASAKKSLAATSTSSKTKLGPATKPRSRPFRWTSSSSRWAVRPRTEREPAPTHSRSVLERRQAMLAALFSPQMDAEHAVHNVFYMQRRVVSRLFQIKVGGERTSSQHIVRSMIQQSENADALPKVGIARRQNSFFLRNRRHTRDPRALGETTVPWTFAISSSKTRDLAYKDANWLEPKPYTVLKWSSPELIKELWSRDDTYREGYCNAVLVACAFFDLICTANPEALSTVSVPSRTKKRKSGLDMS